MRPGLTYEDAFHEALLQVDLAEQIGIESLWLAEQHFDSSKSVLASPIVIAGAVAARTHRIRIGTAVQVLPITNPLRAAEEAATLDHLSKGRLDFGVGRSSLTKFYDGFNIDYAKSNSLFWESLEIIQKAWTEESFSYCGNHYSFRNVELVPKTYQKPHPPIRIAVASLDTFIDVGAKGYPIFVSSTTSFDELKVRISRYQKSWEKAGNPRIGDIMLRIPCYIADTHLKSITEPESSTRSAMKYAATNLATTAGSSDAAKGYKEISSIQYEDMVRERVLYGTPSEIINRITLLVEELSLSGLVLEMNYGGRIPHQRVMSSMRLLADQVIPAFK